jgi:putative restriction endonuclease
MRIYLGVTDSEWYRFLAARPDLDEVNFWQPGGKTRFAAISPGELFLFKLKYPQNEIGGGGFLVRSQFAPIRLAWDAFGEANGAASLESLRQRISRYRSGRPCHDYSCEIGCIILAKPFYFAPDDRIAVPADWSRNIVSGKTYDTNSPTGRRLHDGVLERLQSATRPGMIADQRAAMFSTPVPVRPRLGQGAFRAAVADVYERHCAITRERVLPALVAAHILPVSRGGEHRIDNGLLLRADVHELFDEGYVTITPDLRFRVSRQLDTEFHNGEEYRRFDNTEIWIPPHEVDRPARRFLEWHADTLYRR